MDKNKLYLVYQITNKINKMIYIGTHVTENINDSYMGSGKNIRKDINEFGLENFSKTILYVFNNKEDMLKKEYELVNREFIKRNDTYNIILGGGWNTCETVLVRDKNNKWQLVHINDPRYISGELKHSRKERFPAKNKDGLIKLISKDDPDFINGNFKHINKNMLHTKDVIGNIFYINKNDTRYLSGELFSVWKDTIFVKDKNNKCFRVHKEDPRYLSGELVTLWKDKKHSKETIEKYKKTFKEINHQQGEKNSQFGTCWIYNDFESKKIKKEELQIWISKGWNKGRKIKKLS